MIVKVQRSLDNRRSVLVYNEDRSIFYVCETHEIEGTGDLATEMETLGNALKAYFEAHLDEKKRLVLDGPADEQDW